MLQLRHKPQRTSIMIFTLKSQQISSLPAEYINLNQTRTEELSTLHHHQRQPLINIQCDKAPYCILIELYQCMKMNLQPSIYVIEDDFYPPHTFHQLI